MNRFIYLDYQATTPVDPRVVTEMLPFLTEQFGNPASNHAKGIEAELAITKARQDIAAQLNVSPQEIYFTSGASEGNNLAIKGVLRAHKKGHIITVATEHKCVLNACNRLKQEGFSVTVLPVNVLGFIDITTLENALQEDTIMISVMYGNNETGVLQPIQEIGKLAQKKDIILHCDATQSIGHLPLNPNEWGISLLTFSGHKIYGPKGIGGLYISRELTNNRRILCEIDGGGQEQGMRGGTLNVPGIIGLQKALNLVGNGYNTEPQRLSSLRACFLKALDDGAVDYICNTPLEQSLPHCLNLSFPGINGQQLLAQLSSLGLSATSACSSGSQQSSHVLHAMGVPPNLIDASFRLSIGRYTSQEDVAQAIERLLNALSLQKNPLPLTTRRAPSF